MMMTTISILYSNLLSHQQWDPITVSAQEDKINTKRKENSKKKVKAKLNQIHN
jgi:hypothetical protein